MGCRMLVLPLGIPGYNRPPPRDMFPFPDPGATTGEERLHWAVAAGAPQLPQGSWEGTEVENRDQGRAVPTHLDVVSQLQGAVLSLVGQVDAVQVLWERQDQHPHGKTQRGNTQKKKPQTWEGLGQFLNGSNNSGLKELVVLNSTGRQRGSKECGVGVRNVGWENHIPRAHGAGDTATASWVTTPKGMELNPS